MDAKDSSPRLDDLLPHAPWVRGLARGLLADEASADDAVQETWLAAMRRPPESAGAERSWLSRVVTNAVRQRNRSTVGRENRERAVARPEALPSTADLVGEVEHQQILVEEVLALEEPYKSVVLLRYLRETSAAEIARIQGVPEGTVRSQIARGLERLRVRLDRRFGGVRAAWAVPLAASLEPLAPAPIASPPPSSAGPAAGPLPTWLGALVMQSSLKLALAAGALALAGVSWMVMDGGSSAEGSERGALEAPRAAVTEAPAPAPELVATTDDVPTVHRRAAAETAPIEEPVVETVAAAEEPEHEPADVVVIFTDPLGAPVSGVQAAVVPGEDPLAWRASTKETSAVDGRVEIQVPLSSPRENYVLVYDADGFGRGAVGCYLEAGATSHLGSIALTPDGIVNGRVVDEDGRPIEGAWVWARPAPLPELNVGHLARQGPHVEERFDSGWKALRVQTDATGAFALDSVPAGALHVWSHQDGWRYSHSDELELAPGGSAYGVEVRLEPLRTTDRIAGQVLKPDGTPLANGRMNYDFNDVDLGFSSSTELDDEGRFDLVLMRDVPHTFSVIGNGLLWSDKRVIGVEPGTRDVLIELVEPRTIEIVVRDENDDPVPAFRYKVAPPEGSTGISRSQEQEGASAWLPVPDDDFVVEVAAEGYALNRVGPYDPGALPGEIRVKLEPIPGIRGFVLANGSPVAGAQVELFPIVPPGGMYFLNGFQCRVMSSTETVTTEDDGSFLLSGRKEGTFYLMVSKQGYAPAEEGPFDHDPRTGSAGHEFHLDDGGRLEVQVRAPEGSSHAGVLVGISHGDHHARTGRTDAEGKVVFERLSPGDWYVTQAENEIRPYHSTSTYRSSDDGEDTPPPSNCVVRKARTTHYTLVIGEE